MASFQNCSEDEFEFVVHEDGSLSADDLKSLASSLKLADIITRKQADAEMESALARHPRCAAFRRTYPLALKMFDFVHFAKDEVASFIDSDIYASKRFSRFFEMDSQVSFRFMRDRRSAYSLRPWNVSGCMRLRERINTGIAQIRRRDGLFDSFEEFLGLPQWRHITPWIEQTAFAYVASQENVRVFKPESCAMAESAASKAAPIVHFTGTFRSSMPANPDGALSMECHELKDFEPGRLNPFVLFFERIMQRRF